ncbi:MAG: hypothetical protein AB7N80_11490 [Bdellovibrionales bacterium]
MLQRSTSFLLWLSILLAGLLVSQSEAAVYKSNPTSVLVRANLPGNNSTLLFVSSPTVGSVNVRLHPSAQAVGANAQAVIFGVPFPKGAVSNANLIRALDQNDVEIPSQVSVLSFWRDFQNPAVQQSIRSVRIVVSRSFANTTPINIKIQYGSPRQQNLSGVFDTVSTWQSISLGPNPSEYPAAANVREPIVYATLESEWMSSCLLQTRTATVNSQSAYSVFDNSFLRHTDSAISGTAYQTTSEPWLYDRAQTLFIAYFRTGSVDRLRSAHRAAQFYKANINAAGGFALGGDSKYVYGQSMYYDLMLTGDTTLVPVIERATLPHAGWPTTYSAATNFWTERNSAYALHASLAAYEATGAAAYAVRARSLFNSYFSMQQTPINGWVKNGCTLHTNTQHDPSEALPNVVCSPWMGALLADAIWKYYILSLDNNALIYLADFADFIQQYGLYTSGTARLPYYGASSYGHTDPDGDVQHTCDVMGAYVRGYWAKRELGRSVANLTADRNSLIAACQANVNSSSISPLRKYSWWFGTNSDFHWFMSTF